jgi:hypothetical protein
MSLKRVALWLLLALFVAFVVNQPDEAGHLVKVTGENAKEWFSTASEAFTKFLGSLI